MSLLNNNSYETISEQWFKCYASDGNIIQGDKFYFRVSRFLNSAAKWFSVDTSMRYQDVIKEQIYKEEVVSISSFLTLLWHHWHDLFYENH